MKKSVIAAAVVAIVFTPGVAYADGLIGNAGGVEVPLPTTPGDDIGPGGSLPPNLIPVTPGDGVGSAADTAALHDLPGYVFGSDKSNDVPGS